VELKIWKTSPKLLNAGAISSLNSSALANPSSLKRLVRVWLSMHLYCNRLHDGTEGRRMVLLYSWRKKSEQSKRTLEWVKRKLSIRRRITSHQYEITKEMKQGFDHRLLRANEQAVHILSFDFWRAGKRSHFCRLHSRRLIICRISRLHFSNDWRSLDCWKWKTGCSKKGVSMRLV